MYFAWFTCGMSLPCVGQNTHEPAMSHTTCRQRVVHGCWAFVMQVAHFLQAPITPWARHIWASAGATSTPLSQQTFDSSVLTALGRLPHDLAETICDQHPAATHATLMLVERLQATPAAVHEAVVRQCCTCTQHGLRLQVVLEQFGQNAGASLDGQLWVNGPGAHALRALADALCRMATPPNIAVRITTGNLGEAGGDNEVGHFVSWLQGKVPIAEVRFRACLNSPESMTASHEASSAFLLRNTAISKLILQPDWHDEYYGPGCQSDLDDLLCSVASMPALRDLTLGGVDASYNKVPTRRVLRALRSMTQLTHLQISSDVTHDDDSIDEDAHVSYGSACATALLQALQPGVARQVILWEVIGDQSCSLLSNLCKLSSLTCLELHDVAVEAQKASAWFSKLTANSSLRRLRISSNFDQAEWRAVAETLTQLTVLSSLSFRHATMAKVQIATIMQALPSMQHLADLDLRINYVDDKPCPSPDEDEALLALQNALAASVCADALGELTALQQLQLSQKWFGDAHAELVEALPRLQGLESLSFSDECPPFGARDGSFSSMAQVMAGLTQLTHLTFNMFATRHEHAHADAVAQSLAAMTRLQSLEVARWVADLRGMQLLAPAIAQLSELRSLRLGDYDIDDAGVALLAQHVHRLGKLTSVAFGWHAEVPRGTVRYKHHDTAAGRELIRAVETATGTPFEALERRFGYNVHYVGGIFGSDDDVHEDSVQDEYLNYRATDSSDDGMYLEQSE